MRYYIIEVVDSIPIITQTHSLSDNNIFDCQEGFTSIIDTKEQKSFDGENWHKIKEDER